jgi:tRNA-dihydrouridine synthase
MLGNVFGNVHLTRKYARVCASSTTVSWTGTWKSCFYIDNNNTLFSPRFRYCSPSEKMWGVQLCANNGILAAKAAHAMAECGIDYDFVDLNMGCPLDAIYRQVIEAFLQIL